MQVSHGGSYTHYRTHACMRCHVHAVRAPACTLKHLGSAGETPYVHGADFFFPLNLPQMRKSKSVEAGTCMNVSKRLPCCMPSNL